MVDEAHRLSRAKVVLPPPDKKNKLTLDEANKLWGKVPNDIADTELQLERQKKRQLYMEQKLLYKEKLRPYHDKNQEQKDLQSTLQNKAQHQAEVPMQNEDVDKALKDQHKQLREQRPIAAARYRRAQLQTTSPNGQGRSMAEVHKSHQIP